MEKCSNSEKNYENDFKQMSTHKMWTINSKCQNCSNSIIRGSFKKFV